ncbi:hypothetical protein [Roseateles aquatilis]|nr:hypothetical protein [Roseateles aquatilis]
MLHENPTVEGYGAWLKLGLVDVNRLAGFPDFKLIHEPAFGG